MASRPDDIRARIEAYPWPPRCGGIEVVRASKGYTLYSRRTGGPVARLRPTGQGDQVQVLWWRPAILIGRIAARGSSCELSLDMGRRF